MWKNDREKRKPREREKEGRRMCVNSGVGEDILNS
jgi:hypothetical protein